MNGFKVPTEIVNEIRSRALTYLEHQPRGRQHYSLFSDLTGYSESSIKSFMADEPGKSFSLIAQAMVEAVPELGDGLICRECGRLRGGNVAPNPAMGFAFTRR